MAELGVIVTCQRGDMHLARGCCASIRHFLGDIPICLLTDGEVPADDLVTTYGVAVLRNIDNVDRELAELCRGWGRTSLMALWEAPWPSYLKLDADTIVWGNVLAHARLDRYDLVVDRHLAASFPSTQSSLILATLLGSEDLAKTRKKRKHVSRWFFDPMRLGDAFPEIDWLNRLDDLFCPGAYFARRGALRRERFIELADLGARDPTLFSRGDMGIFNALVLLERARVHHRPDFQIMVHMEDQEAMRTAFPVDRVLERNGAGVVIHWAGSMKPTLQGELSYSDPMTFFRRKFLRDTGRRDPEEIDHILTKEDYQMRAAMT